MEIFYNFTVFVSHDDFVCCVDFYSQKSISVNLRFVKTSVDVWSFRIQSMGIILNSRCNLAILFNGHRLNFFSRASSSFTLYWSGPSVRIFNLS